jgi:hypothetical protein
MEYASQNARREPSRRRAGGPVKPLELRVWVELPVRRSRFPIRRKPSMSLGLRHWEPLCVSGTQASVPGERAPTLRVEPGLLGIVVAFLAAVTLGLLGRGLEAMLMWAL